MSKNQQITIISHDKCSDGLAAAHCCNSTLKKQGYSTETFFYGHQNKHLESVKQNQPLIDSIKNSAGLYVLDFSFDKDVLSYFYELNPNLILTVIDHHKTAKEDFDDIFNSTDEKYNQLKENIDSGKFKFEFNNNYSGAVLSYIYFVLREKPSLYQGQRDEEIPHFIKYIQDRDIFVWKHKEQSEPFNEIFFAQIKNLKDIEQSFNLDDKTQMYANAKKFADAGKHVVDYRNNQIKEIMANKREIGININGKLEKGYIICANHIFSSNLGATLYKLDKEHDFSIVWSEDKDGKIKAGARSKPDFDCSVIARHFNGGGHKNAAGFGFNSLEEFVEARKGLLDYENNSIQIVTEENKVTQKRSPKP